MTERCPECEAPLESGQTCQEHFHALLVLEGQVPGAPGSMIHFYTVACYVLQHPDSMNNTAAALQGLRVNLVDALDGTATLSDLRRRARNAAEGAARITRRSGDPTPTWRRGAWPMSVADVCSVKPDEYVETVLRWARSIRETLDAD